MIRLPDPVVPFLGLDPASVSSESLSRVVGLAESLQVDWKRETGRGQSPACERAPVLLTMSDRGWLVRDD